MNRHHIMRNSSAFYRLTQMYWTEKLKPYGLGAGQQYFLIQIDRRPGITPAELAERGAFDGGTVTRACHKLETAGYIAVSKDKNDGRVRRLTLTDAGKALLEPIRSMLHEWMSAVTEGFTEDEKALIGSLMGRLADNARAHLTKGEEAE